MEKTQKSQIFRNLLYLLRKVLSVAPWLTTCWCLAVLITAGISAAELLVLRETVNTLVSSDTLLSTYPWVLTLCLLFFTQHIFNSCIPLLREHIRIKAGYTLQHTALEKMGKLPLEAFDEEDSHNLINRVVTHGEASTLQLLGGILGLLEILPMLLTSYVILGMLSFWVVVSLLIGTLLLRYYEIQMGRRVRHFEVEHTHTKRLADYYSQLLTERQNAPEIRLWDIGDTILRRWWETLREYLNLQLRVSLKNESQGLLHVLGFTTFLTIALLIITHTQGSIEPGLAALVLSALWNIAGGMNAIQGYAIRIVEHAGHGEDLHKLLEGLPTEQTSVISSQHQTLHPIQDSISLQNVSYRYPGTDTDALSNITLKIRAGEILAIVGENGAGKTTLAHILAGLRSPTQGSITIDDVDLAEIPPGTHRRACSMVFQHPTHYPARLQENIQLNSDPNPDVYLDATLHHVGLSDKKFSHNPFLSPEFGGIDISGGEWQRVAIARCLIKTDAQIVIFDEPTASLDPLAELEIFEEFMKFVDGKTTILIAHRLGITQHVDRVALLENGHLVEIDPPTVLLNTKSKYAHMFETQRQWYL